MAITDKLLWSTAAASNTTLGASITLDGTVMTPSQVDDAFRELMSQDAKTITRHVTKAAGSYTPAKADHNQFWRCTGAVTLNLTAAATLTDGWCLWVRANGGAVTIDPSGAETIDGATTLVLADGQTVCIICNASTFYTIMQGTAGAAGAFPIKADGRLTLETGVAVSTTDQLAKGTIYYTPYCGNVISLYSGTGWVNRTFSELSLALSATSGKPYDVFVYDNAGVATLETLVWTNDTTRATALVRQDGVWCKTGVLTRRYVGTFYASAANQTEDSRKARYVWNMDNRVLRHCANTVETTDTWNYTLTTVRQANANTANEFAFVRGLDEEAMEATLTVGAANSNLSVFIYVGMGLDSTTAFIAAPELLPGFHRTAVAGAYAQMTSTYRGLPGVGKHRLTWLEASNATGTTTWVGDIANVSNNFQSGMVGSVRA